MSDWVPSWWQFALLALAAFRLFKLIADDTILDRPRDWLLKRTGEKTELFIACPWCAGWWLSLAFTVAWWLWPTVTLAVAVPFAVSAVVALIAVTLDPD